MKQLFVILIALILNNSLQAQSEDFVITQSGDTLAGNLYLQRNNLLIVNDQGTIVTPYTDLKYMRNGGKSGSVFYGRFMYYEDKIDHDSKLADRMTDTIILVKPIYETPMMNLLIGHDQVGTEYFFVQRPKDSLPTVLMVRYSFPGRNDLPRAVHLSSTKKIEAKFYLNQLKALFDNCKGIDNWDYEALEYRSYSFKKIIRRFNRKCK